MGSLETASIRRIDRSKPHSIIDAIFEYGCCIITNFTDAETISKVNAETRPFLDADKPWKGDLFPPETRRCTNLCGRSKTARENWLIDPLIGTLTSKFLDKTDTIWHGDTQKTYTSEAQINIALTLEIGPGGQAQRLHRDDKNYHADYRDRTTTGYQLGSEAMMGFMIPGVKTTRENGATVAIPGSHLWGADRAPKVEEAVCVELSVGECFVLLGSLYHGGGTNSTQDVKRTLHGLFFTRGYYRQEENIYIANKPDEVLSWSPQAQKLLGYHLSHPNIGYTQDFLTPVEFMSGEKREKLGDFKP